MTPNRYAKLRMVLARRQPDLTLLLDNVHKTHNFSAILRSCDAVGVLEAHAIWPGSRIALHHMTAAGTGKWLRVTTHRDLQLAAATLRERGFRLVAAHSDSSAIDFRAYDYTQPTALLLGAELNGVSEAALDACDLRIQIPMSGMVTSLNVSVAGAIILYEAQRQREAVGLYNKPRIEAELFNSLIFEWAYPEVAQACQRREMSYPELDEDGNLPHDFHLT